MKKLNNKGFSLVELIIVIAIMAVLIGVLAPQFLRYVERSRRQTDETAIEELRKSVEIGLGTEAIATEISTALATASPYVITIDTAGATNPGTLTVPTTLMQGEVSSSVGLDLDFTSNAYTQAATGTVSVEIINNATGDGFEVQAWGLDQGNPPARTRLD